MMTEPEHSHDDAPGPEPRGTGPGEAFRLLFVCTGNTCRSPLAEVLARRAIERLHWDHVEVSSAGIAASVGHPASEGSVEAAARHGLDLTAHRSAPLSRALVDQADLILTMSPGHLAALVPLGGEERAAVITDFVEDRGSGASGGRGVPDPIGGDARTYEETFRALEDLVDRALVRIAPLVAP